MRAAGITRVDGDVVIDDRLFTPISWPDGLISPIWVNENLIDIEVTPGASTGQPTTIDWRPKTASYTVETQATTVDASGTTSLAVAEPSPRPPRRDRADRGRDRARRWSCRRSPIPSAFARTAFIEALQRAGVTVAATPTGPNPAPLLPAEAATSPTTSSASTCPPPSPSTSS